MLIIAIRLILLLIVVTALAGFACMFVNPREADDATH